MTQPFATARDVSEHLLDMTGRAIMGGDLGLFMSCFRLPTEVETFEGKRRIRTARQLEQMFHAVTTHYQRIGVTDMVRHCVEASFSDPKTVVAMHDTRLMSGNILIHRPFSTLSVLRFDGIRWQIASSSHAIDDERDHTAALLAAGDVPPGTLLSKDRK